MKTIISEAWISVEERLPENDTEVVGYFNDKTISTIYFLNEEEGFDPYKDPLHIQVTHWIPLPAPPKV